MTHSSNSSIVGTISRRSFLGAMAAAGVATLGSVCLPAKAHAATKTPAWTPKDAKIAIMSDLHFFAPELYGEGTASASNAYDTDDFTEVVHQNVNLVVESYALLKKACEEIVKAEPDIVLVPGDITKDGELASHQGAHKLIVKMRDELAKKGVNTKVYVINGNHDINNPHAADFSSGKRQMLEVTTPQQFRDVWNDFGPSEAIATFGEVGEAGGLSYAVRPMEGLTILGIDSCMYTADQTANQEDLCEVGGYISEELQRWITTQTIEAQQRGDVVLPMQHHGLIVNCDVEDTGFFSTNLVENHEETVTRYAEAGIGCVLTGHRHRIAISKVATTAGHDLVEIQTDAIVMYPAWIRFGQISWKVEGLKAEARLSVDVQELGSIHSGKQKKMPVVDVEDATECAGDYLLSVESMPAVVDQEVFTPWLSVVKQSGVGAYLKEKLGIQDEEGAEEDLSPASRRLSTMTLPRPPMAVARKAKRRRCWWLTSARRPSPLWWRTWKPSSTRSLDTRRAPRPRLCSLPRTKRCARQWSACAT